MKNAKLQHVITEANDILFKYKGVRLDEDFVSLLTVFDDLPSSVKFTCSFYTVDEKYGTKKKIKLRVIFPNRDFIFDLFPDKTVLVGSRINGVYKLEELPYKNIRNYIEREFPEI